MTSPALLQQIANPQGGGAVLQAFLAGQEERRRREGQVYEQTQRNTLLGAGREAALGNYDAAAATAFRGGDLGTGAQFITLADKRKQAEKEAQQEQQFQSIFESILGGGGYDAQLASMESGNDPNAVNPLSGATGTYGFMPDTWAGIDKQAPELGLTPEGMKDPRQQEKAKTWLKADNGRIFQNNMGRPPTETDNAFMHRFGAPAALRLLRMNPNTPLERAFGPRSPVMLQNPDLAGKTVGQVYGEYQSRFGFGTRPDGSQKGSGFLGVLRRPDGTISTEISISTDAIGGKDFPLLVPTLTKDEVNKILAVSLDDPNFFKKIPQSAIQKAQAFAEQRVAAGKSPFAGNNETRQQPNITQTNRRKAALLWQAGDHEGAIKALFEKPEKIDPPAIETFFDPVTGLQHKAQWNPETEQWDRVGGTKSDDNGITITNPDGTTTQIGGSGSKVTEGMRRAKGFKASMKSSIESLQSNFTALTDPRNYIGDVAKNFGGRRMMTPEGQMAADNFEEVVADALYIASGATLTAPEVERKKAAIIPTPNDSPQTIAAKKRRLDDLVAAVDVMAGDAPGVSQSDDTGDGVEVYDAQGNRLK